MCDNSDGELVILDFWEDDSRSFPSAKECFDALK